MISALSHALVAVLCVALAAGAALARDDQQPARTDAAEKVGEGNAQRWLEYYRRERGADWQKQEPATPGAAPTELPKPAPPPDADPPARRR